MTLHLYTIGQIADKAGVPIYRVEYLVRNGKVEPAQRIGNYRLFSKAQAEELGKRVGQSNRRGRPLKGR